MSDSVYEVHFKLGELRRKVTIPPHRAIGDVQSGFWINRQGKWTVGQDAKYWIPPGRVLFVKCRR